MKIVFKKFLNNKKLSKTMQNFLSPRPSPHAKKLKNIEILNF